ncbi:MAG TPA: nickel-responsive transcriptional regulator NikR [Candidatus Ratteibacteria bacterium]|jgi:CopG family nickel-responsive transcriptional regulator|uniref:Putative nickel-responsive regulator n=1 Tax=candidate division TA06 bacterium ADurb.Bin131 TaxID=1852827 RepID=A0A1V6CCY8_UNCT6|nr:MAG: putative nickel-responsive regulator [candidate division TA06 bacterium ADurb.Bin131]HOC03598.1 nickel-responsive transcriptional regulator NikR [bacterium]HRS06595.1 nickel-responsive transcriptional regulator NikR [Candidatus Ratteibacteria bacterium]HON05752.1 nickel-responsive transcriptional regulator NikR [bacterium]HOQ81671.1 nickel-responsive transcriptional regulator NikR [bacterium]
MHNIVRFGVSLEKEILERFDRLIKQRKYSTRSKAIEDLIRKEFVEDRWLTGKEIAGAIVFIYNHHKRNIANKIIDIQHDFGGIVISTQHVHLSNDECLEIIVVKGNPSKVKSLADSIRSIKGVEHCTVAFT